MPTRPPNIPVDADRGVLRTMQIFRPDKTERNVRNKSSSWQRTTRLPSFTRVSKLYAEMRRSVVLTFRRAARPPTPCASRLAWTGEKRLRLAICVPTEAFRVITHSKHPPPPPLPHTLAVNFGVENFESGAHISW